MDDLRKQARQALEDEYFRQRAQLICPKAYWRMLGEFKEQRMPRGFDE
jgi:hypothetical protein